MCFVFLVVFVIIRKTRGGNCSDAPGSKPWLPYMGNHDGKLKFSLFFLGPEFVGLFGALLFLQGGRGGPKRIFQGGWLLGLVGPGVFGPAIKRNTPFDICLLVIVSYFSI